MVVWPKLGWLVYYPLKFVRVGQTGLLKERMDWSGSALGKGLVRIHSPISGIILLLMYRVGMYHCCCQLSNRAMSIWIVISPAWKTNTGLPMSNKFSFPTWRWSTNVFVFLCFCSKCHIDCSQLSSNVRSYSFRIPSNCYSSSHFTTCTRRLGIWNSMGITTSHPNASQNGVDQIMVLYVVWYAHSAATM